jgi:hypothetical protein
MPLTTQAQSFPYEVCQITDRHITRHGVIQVPNSGADGSPPALIKVHAAYQYRIVEFFIRCVGAPPAIPADTPQTGEVIKISNFALESAQIQVGQNTPTSVNPFAGSGFSGGGANAAAGAAGSNATELYAFTARGRYVFLKTEVVPQSQLSYPQAAYDTTPPQAIPAASLMTTLLGDDGGSEGSSSVTPGGGP